MNCEKCCEKVITRATPGRSLVWYKVWVQTWISGWVQFKGLLMHLTYATPDVSRSASNYNNWFAPTQYLIQKNDSCWWSRCWRHFPQFLFQIQFNLRKSTTWWLSNDDRFENWRIILAQDHGIKPFVLLWIRIVMIVLLSMRSGRDKNTNYSKYEQRYDLLGSGWVK